ncbi:DNA replication protein [Teratosphaeriaceae sp. CCFEE 6253]|nr:DNA replication protein [Teratosphaeriaceae sp. CCFEE 6253]
MAYYSPTAILTDAQKSPTTFLLAVPALAPLLNPHHHAPTTNNHSNHHNHTPLTPGTRLDLPLWLAEMLAVSKPSGPDSAPLATLDMPSALGPRVMNALRADPKSVELRGQAAWFYGLGERMLELFEEEEVGGVLLETFKQRAFEISDRAQNTRTAQHGGESGDFMSGLDETERLCESLFPQWIRGRSR